ncbi:MAG: sugar phosphate isomerase/epimerase, partial [Cyclobacteriaceae bacterium]|nr:sugar phosphate isomerase/epimerase [Cyclobacteriaceae bacterium SS2]
MNNYPKLHNATWPGVVGKGPDSEPPIPFDDMLKMTAAAEVNGVKFDGVDLGLLPPHIDIEGSKDDFKRIADKIAGYGLKVGSLVAPIWGGPAMGSK